MELSEKQQQHKEDYQWNVTQIQRQLQVVGMFEDFYGFHYEVHNDSVNPTDYDWKTYNNTIVENGHHLHELQFDLNDAAIRGTIDTIKQMELVFSTFQLWANLQNILIDAYDNCTSTQNTKCNSVITESFAKLVNFQKSHQWEKYKSLPSSGKPDFFKDIQAFEQSVVSTTTKEQEKMWMSTFYNSGARPILYYLKKEYSTQLTNQFDASI